MIDLREHRAVILEAVAIERQNDEQYSWNVHSVTRNRAQIGWTYLGRSEFFEITAEEDEHGEVFVSYRDPHNNFRGGYIVGSAFYCEYHSLNEALAACVRAIARNAHHLY